MTTTPNNMKRDGAATDTLAANEAYQADEV